ncbi:MAG: hypothetical protein SPI25_01210 [Dialister sp.]|nr:hypothetical protein [Dialister sp.]
MTMEKKRMFGRILKHREEAAHVFPHLGEKGKEFTDYVQGAPVTKIGLAEKSKRIGESFSR